MPNNETPFTVERIDYSQLIQETHDRAERINQIRQTAQSICDRRKHLAQHLKDSVLNIHEENVVVENAISNVEQNLNMIQDDNVVSEIRTICSTLKADLNQYEASAKQLSERFENQKIKISSIGFRSQGKSNFTCLYSGLPESVVAVKGPVDEEDKTGAINIIHHKQGVPSSNPEIWVTFRSKQEVLQRVNDFLSQWPEAINGKSRLSTYAELHNMKGSAAVCSAIEHFSGQFDTSIKKGLLGFLGSDIDLSEVGKNPTRINVSKLPKYNDIQYSGQDGKSYSAVDHIDIYVDLQNNGLFENFEICDTKGSSTDVGGLVADKDIFSSIDSSDAAFTIIRVGQGQKGSEFITNVLYPHYKENIDTVNNKHFVIINVDERCGQVQTVDNACEHIADNKIAQAIYVGSFRERPIRIDYLQDEQGFPTNPNEPKVNPSLFVEGVILDMLARIADSTEKNDDALIQIINCKAVSVNDNIQKLKKILNELPELVEESEDGLIIDVIRNLRDKTYDQINDVNRNAEDEHSNNTARPSRARRGGFNINQNQQSENNEPIQNEATVSYTVEQPDIIDYEEQYKKIRSEKNSIFKLLTGEERSIRGKENQSVKDEIDESVRFIYTHNGNQRPVAVDRVTDTISARRCGDTSDSGRFIECISMMYSERIKENFNKKLIPQNEILFKSEADDLFKILWNGLKLNRFTGWGDYSLQNFSEKSVLNEQLKAIFDLYTDAYEATTDPISLFSPYDALLDYFKRFLEKEGNINKRHKETDNVIDDEILISTLVDLIRVHNIPKMIVDKATDKERRVDNLRTQISQEIAPQTSFVQRMLPLYRLPEASPVFSNELRQRRELNEKIRKFNSAKETVITLSNITTLSIPV